MPAPGSTHRVDSSECSGAEWSFILALLRYVLQTIGHSCRILSSVDTSFNQPVHITVINKVSATIF